jgi:hypothetical protein
MSSSSSPSEPDSESDPVVRYMRGTTCSRSFAAHAPNVSVNMKGNSRSRSRSLLLPPFPRQSATISIEGVHESQSTAPRRESAAPTRSRHSSRASAAAGHCTPLEFRHLPLDPGVRRRGSPARPAPLRLRALSHIAQSLTAFALTELRISLSYPTSQRTLVGSSSTLDWLN